MSRNREDANYISFLLRLYRVHDKEGPVWRISLEPSLTGERKGFGNLDEFVEFLRQQMGMMLKADRDED
jgi:hypothetical protein